MVGIEDAIGAIGGLGGSVADTPDIIGGGDTGGGVGDIAPSIIGGAGDVGAGAVQPLSPEGLSLTGQGGGIQGPPSSINFRDSLEPLPGSQPWLGDFVRGAGDVAKGALPFASLGLTGVGIANMIQGQQQAAQQNRILRRSQGLQERAAVPLTNFGEAQLREAQSGKSPREAQIELWAQGAKQKAADYLARAGINDSSTAQQWFAWVDQQAEAMREQSLMDVERTGISALQGAAGASAQLGQTANQQQGGIENMILMANQALARLAASAA